MSGRGYGRGRGRQPFGGRGNGGRGSGGRGYNNNNNRNRSGNGNRGSQVNKKKIMKFQPNSAKDEKFEGYAKIMKAFLLDVEKTYDGAEELIEAVKTGKHFDWDAIEPQPTTITDDNKDIKEQINIRYQNLHQDWLDKKNVYTQTHNKARSKFIDEYCTREMQTKLSSDPEWKHIEKDLVKLGPVVRELMRSAVRAVYPFRTLTETMLALLEVKQKHEESLDDYITRIKTNRDTFKAMIGTTWLDEFVKTTKEYAAEADPSDKKRVTGAQQAQLDGAFEQWISYLIVHHSDNSKYGGMIQGWVDRYSQEEDKFPKTVEKATDALDNHTWEQTYYDNKKKRAKQREQRDRQQENERQQQNEERPASFAQGRNCYCCGDPNHLSDQCNRRNIPRAEWWINKAVQHYQENQNDGGGNDNNNDNANGSGNNGNGSGNGSGTTARPRNSRSIWEITSTRGL